MTLYYNEANLGKIYCEPVDEKLVNKLFKRKLIKQN